MSNYTTDKFLNLEEQVWMALVQGDKTADARLLCDDFLGVYSSGFAGKKQHVDQLHDGPSIVSYELSDARLKVLAVDVVLLSYLACLTRERDVALATASKMYVTSIWQRFDGIWKNVFSQDTSADE
jgi:hypothetical protein